jgi:hypothetical protein
MKKTIYLFALAGLAAAACGDNMKTGGNNPDGNPGMDGSGSNHFPAAPTLGAQVDRLGRPAINTALNNLLTADAAAKGSAKDAYNKDGDPSMWQTNWTGEFAKNLAIFDAVDTGVCGNTICEDQLPGLENALTCPLDCDVDNPIHGRDGCGNLPKYMPDANGSAAPTSNLLIAGLLADDELYLDTSKTMCNAYLGVEFIVVTGLPVQSCGGRAPSYDVIDTSYSVLTQGLSGFDPNTLAPLFDDGAVAPMDGMSDTTFPFLAPPHA